MGKWLDNRVQTDEQLDRKLTTQAGHINRQDPATLKLAQGYKQLSWADRRVRGWSMGSGSNDSLIASPSLLQPFKIFYIF